MRKSTMSTAHTQFQLRMAMDDAYKHVFEINHRYLNAVELLDQAMAAYEERYREYVDFMQGDESAGKTLERAEVKHNRAVYSYKNKRAALLTW